MLDHSLSLSLSLSLLLLFLLLLLHVNAAEKFVKCISWTFSPHCYGLCLKQYRVKVFFFYQMSISLCASVFLSDSVYVSLSLSVSLSFFFSVLSLLV